MRSPLRARHAASAGALIAVAIALAASAATAAPSAAVASYGPSYGRFAIAFPSDPTEFPPTGGGDSPYVYSDMTPSGAFLKTKTPKPPAFWMIVAKPVNQLVWSLLHQGLKGVKHEKLGGLKVYIWVVRESRRFFPENMISDSRAIYGELLAHRGQTLYEAQAVANSATTVRAFLDSFRAGG